MACKPLITNPFVFPRRAGNRPGLPRVAYRIGRYADFREAMLRAIDAAPELAAWTHRGADDPGIALVEGAAILGDILSFYQEHYANEAWLRTAAWRDSIAELVRLSGYRLAPGIAGRATFAFEVRGSAPVTLRQGFPLKADLAELATPADFMTEHELVALPALSRFHLYRKRQYGATIPAQSTLFELAGVDGAGDEASLAAFDLKPGDRLLLQPPEPAWTSSGTSLAVQQAPQAVKVKKVTPLLGRVIVEIDAPIAQAWNAPVAALRVNRTFRHYGHNAPPQTVTNTTDGGGKINGARQSATAFARHVGAGHVCANTSCSIGLDPQLVPLDIEVPDLRVGQLVVVQTRVTIGTTTVDVSLTRRIAAAAGGTLGFGNLNGPTTLLRLDAPLVRHAMAGSPTADVRDYRIHEATSPRLALKPLSTPASGAFAGGTNALWFHGSVDEVRALAQRRLFLSHADGRELLVTCTNETNDFVAPDAVPRLWPLSFDRTPAPFLRADFDEAAPAVTVFGNLAECSQGKAERDATLGSGDRRQDWQTFALPKSPLTYFLAPGDVPPQRPQLEVWVAGRLWTRVAAFYGRGPQETVYIVREDAEGRSFVQFGDGKTGARLPSGVDNVVARYRSGVGAYGPIKPGATPSASERPPGFDKALLAGIVAGGAAPEDGDKARIAAPGKVQSLGRLVSIRDYETEALAVPGVVTASAAWDLAAGVPALVLRVLLAAGREAEFAAVRATLAHAQRCRGPDRFAFVVEQALLRYVYLDLVYARDPGRRQDDVEAAIRAVLGLADDEPNARSGVFGLRARQLGEMEYASRIEGRVQNVDGVLWCKVTGLGRFAAGTGAALVLPPSPRAVAAVVACNAHELLQLAPPHLSLTPAAEPSAGECA